MKQEYIVTEQELKEKGLNLEDYALDGTLIPAIISKGLDICVTRCCFNFDNIGSEEELETALDQRQDKVGSFKKLQRQILWNLIFMGQDDPVDTYVDTIICHEINLGKINGVQKGLWYKNY